MNQTKEYSMYLSVSVDTQRYKRKLAPGAYAASLPDVLPDRAVWGEGHVSNSEVLFAYGVMHILDDILIEEMAEITGDEDDFVLNVYVKNAGSQDYTQHVPKWLSRNNLNSSREEPNNFANWKRFYELCCLKKIIFIEGAEEHDVQQIGAVHAIASQRRRAMADTPSDAQDGIVRVGEDPVSSRAA